MSLSRYFHTVRYLRPIQVTGRLRRLIKPAPRTDGPLLPLRDRKSAWVPGPARSQSFEDDGQFFFLNRRGKVEGPAGWNDTSVPKLWLYNLHYFDDLASPAANEAHERRRADVVAAWIAENPPGYGNGWEPYPISLRVVNWIKWSLAGFDFPDGWHQSLGQQVRSLMGQIEWHLLGNHLLANAKALVFAGLYFDGPEAERWLSQGLAIYAREWPEQILADGGHFELSPMYHAIILEDLFDIINVARVYGADGHGVIKEMSARAGAMRNWLAVMTHPDGGPAFFNDTTFGIAPSRQDLEDYAVRLGLPTQREPGEGLIHLPQSGYVRIARGDAVAILDVAAIGPDYLPGHAHADTLSFELSLGRERVFVNGGISTYAADAQRHAERSTVSHNTVEIGGKNSSDVWGAFRVARRARVRELRIESHGGVDTVTAAHDGYRRLEGRPVHRRTWRMGRGWLEVEDVLEGAASGLGASAAGLEAARYHLPHAEGLFIDQSGTAGHVTTPAGRTVRWNSDAVGVIEPSQWRPGFNLRVAATCLAMPLPQGRGRTAFDWM